jgi:hypothetical protein
MKRAQCVSKAAAALKRDEEENRQTHTHGHRRRSGGLQGGPGWKGFLVLGMGEGGGAQIHFPLKPDRPSPYSQFLAQHYGPQEVLM